jgi:hypothetical protein
MNTHVYVCTADGGEVTPCTSKLQVMGRDTRCTTMLAYTGFPAAGNGDGYTMYIHTAGGGEGYTKHVYTASWCGLMPSAHLYYRQWRGIRSALHTAGGVDGYTLHVHTAGATLHVPTTDLHHRHLQAVVKNTLAFPLLFC